MRRSSRTHGRPQRAVDPALPAATTIMAPVPAATLEGVAAARPRGQRVGCSMWVSGRARRWATRPPRPVVTAGGAAPHSPGGEVGAGQLTGARAPGGRSRGPDRGAIVLIRGPNAWRALCLLSALAASACASPAAPANRGAPAADGPAVAASVPSTAAPPAAPLPKIRSAWATDTASELPLPVGIEAGLFAKHGLDVSAERIAGG